ncbi:MAG: DASS family sodium-coupled anion symporter [Phycisphaerales bacterium]|nr:DASS family sodium-coupled anion symporter [Phycisphaerales bacterium]
MRTVSVKFTRRSVVIDLSWGVALRAALCIALTTLAVFLPIPGLDAAAARTCFVIFVAAATLWVTELIPAFATSIVVIVLSVYLLGSPADPGEGQVPTWQNFINPVASPVLVLFFGGFILAQAATKHGFDIRLARAFITPFGTRPASLLLGVILTTGLFSMFMSNTATAAMMLAIVAPLLGHLERESPVRKMLVLAVPFAANIGGMGTLIGTPPNAVAASVLQQLGPEYTITFLGWMLFGFPLAAILLLLLWGTLLLIFRPGAIAVEITFPATLEVTPALAIVVTTFTATILLWLTQPLHGIPAAVVALLPVAVFPAFNIINREDLKKLDWDVIILVAGGLTLGVAMHESGLSRVLVEQIPFHLLPIFLVLLLLCGVALVLSNFMSNTSAANLLIPIATSITMLSPQLGAVAVALGCTLAMSLPISTPPNAIAFATRTVSTRDMVLVGTLISAIGLAVLMAALAVVSPWLPRPA